MAGEIVLGYDGSDCAKAALTEAAAIAKAFGTSVVVAFGYASNPMGGETQDEENSVRGIGQHLATEAEAALQADGVAATSEIVHDRPAEAILAVAVEHQARMIVVGSTGQGPVLGAILGSVPYKLLHRSPVPVLVVPVPTAATTPSTAPAA